MKNSEDGFNTMRAMFQGNQFKINAAEIPDESVSIYLIPLLTASLSSGSKLKPDQNLWTN